MFLHRKTRQEEGVGLGSGGMARGYEFREIGGELFWPDFAAKKSWGGYDGSAARREDRDEGERAGRGEER